jgi:hypothetical protein
MLSSSTPICACSLLLVSRRSFRSAWFNCYCVESVGTSYGTSRTKLKLNFTPLACFIVDWLRIPGVSGVGLAGRKTLLPVFVLMACNAGAPVSSHSVVLVTFVAVSF